MNLFVQVIRVSILRITYMQGKNINMNVFIDNRVKVNLLPSLFHINYIPENITGNLQSAT